MRNEPSLQAVNATLHQNANPTKARILQSFFKTGPGEYGEGDIFLGIQVPVLRKIARQHRGLAFADIESLLLSPLHEARLLALMLLVDTYDRGDLSMKKKVFALYLASTTRINNWDLVDLSAPSIVGDYLLDRSRTPLHRLSRSKSLWERRISIVATYRFIRAHDFKTTFTIASRLLKDPEDLIHKATGWMLREVGKRNSEALEDFLKQHCRTMPRTMLRYAIERFPEPVRQRYLKGI